MQGRKISVVIPAKNEEKTIAEIIVGAKPYSDEVLVVDGHSTDHTRDIAKKLGARVELDHGRGKGDAIRIAIEKARGDIILFIDADGSHDPHDIPKIVAPILNGEADMVIGSRGRGGSDEAWGTIGDFIRNVGGHMTILAINYRYNARLTDSQNGFRALTTVLAKKLNLKEDITTIEQEMLTKALKLKARVTDVPSHEYKRKFGNSRFKVWKVAPRYIWSILKCMF